MRLKQTTCVGNVVCSQISTRQTRNCNCTFPGPARWFEEIPWFGWSKRDYLIHCIFQWLCGPVIYMPHTLPRQHSLPIFLSTVLIQFCLYHHLLFMVTLTMHIHKTRVQGQWLSASTFSHFPCKLVTASWKRRSGLICPADSTVKIKWSLIRCSWILFSHPGSRMHSLQIVQSRGRAATARFLPFPRSSISKTYIGAHLLSDGLSRFRAIFH